MEVSQFPNNYLQRKQEDQYLVQNAILSLTIFHAVAACNKRIDALFPLILLYSSEVWGAYDRTDAKKQQKDPIEKIHTHFYKHSIGLNRRATNIISRNEAGRLSLKSKININVIKFWLHLTSTAKQCLLLSN